MNFNQKVILTGASGFIGNHIKNALLRMKVRIVEVDYLPPLSENILKPIDFLEQLSSTISKNNKPMAILHFGAHADATSSDLKLINERNILFSDAIANIAANYGIKLIFASSAAIYGNGTSEKFLSPYAKSKKITEERILELDAPNQFILRLFNVWGSGEDHKRNMMSVPSVFIRDAKLKNKIEIWSIENTLGEPVMQSRDFIHVQDIVTIVIRLLEKETPTPQIFDIGSGVSFKFDDLAELICKLTGAEYSIVPFPKNLNPKYYQIFTKANCQPLIDFLGGYTLSSLHQEIGKLILEQV